MKRWTKVTEIINLTPHEISVMVGDTMKRIPASGNVVRMSSRCERCGDINGMQIVRVNDGETRGMPEPKDGTVYIVSSVVAKTLRRKDVLSPDTSDDGVIRDGNGYIIGVKRLQVFV
jgi:hypothetical protein